MAPPLTGKSLIPHPPTEGPKRAGPWARMREGENDGRRTAGGADPWPVPDRRPERHRARADARSPTCRRVHGGFCRGHLHRCPEAFSREGQKTMGTHVDLSYVAATPVGMRVTAQMKLVAVED